MTDTPKPSAPEAREIDVILEQLESSWPIAGIKIKNALEKLRTENASLAQSSLKDHYLHSDDNYYFTKEASDKFRAVNAENAQLRLAHEELLSYLPKVPQEPHHKAMAKEIVELRRERDEWKQAWEIITNGESSEFEKERDSLMERLNERITQLSIKTEELSEIRQLYYEVIEQRNSFAEEIERLKEVIVRHERRLGVNDGEI